MNSLPHPAEDHEGIEDYEGNDVEFPPFVEPVTSSFDRRSGDGSHSVGSPSLAQSLAAASEVQRRAEFSRSPIMERIGPWRLVREIGHGGMGIVYEAVHDESGARAALKFLLSAVGMDQRRLDRFLQEARVIERLSHPNIVQLRSVEQIDGRHFLVMQLIDGIGLDRVVGSISTHNSSPTAKATVPGLKSSRNLDPRVNLQPTWLDKKLFDPGSNRFRYIATLVQQAAQALSYAHAQRVSHRDIKPSNLLVDHNDVLWITDFGLAQIQGEDGLTATGDLLGTLRYMSPEQAMASRVPVDHRTDVYSLGVTAYELLCGRPAFDAEDRKELLRQVLFDDSPRLSSIDVRIPVPLQIICEKAMQKDARHRYSTAGEMADDLFRFLSDSPIRARRPRAWELGLRWCKRNMALTASITMLTVLLTVLTVGRFLYNEMSERHEQTVNLLKRTEAAERESSAFANLRSVTRYRQTGLAGLSDHMNLLEMNSALLSDDARDELRSEWLSCMARADWRFTKTIQCSASVAAVSHSRDLVAEVVDESSPVGSQQIRIRSLSGNVAPITSDPVGFDVKGISFSSGDKYLVITNLQEQWQILRCDDGSHVFNLPQSARGCDVNESTERAAFWHYSSTITFAALNREAAALVSAFDAPSPPDLVRFSPDGTMLALLRNSVVLHQVAQSSRVKIHARWTSKRSGPAAVTSHTERAYEAVKNERAKCQANSRRSDHQRIVNIDRFEQCSPCILSPCISMLGTESGTEVLQSVTKYRTTQKVQPPTAKHPFVGSAEFSVSYKRLPHSPGWRQLDRAEGPDVDNQSRFRPESRLRESDNRRNQRLCNCCHSNPGRSTRNWTIR